MLSAVNGERVCLPENIHITHVAIFNNRAHPVGHCWHRVAVDGVPPQIAAPVFNIMATVPTETGRQIITTLRAPDERHQEKYYAGAGYQPWHLIHDDLNYSGCYHTAESTAGQVSTFSTLSTLHRYRPLRNTFISGASERSDWQYSLGSACRREHWKVNHSHTLGMLTGVYMNCLKGSGWPDVPKETKHAGALA